LSGSVAADHNIADNLKLNYIPSHVSQARATIRGAFPAAPDRGPLPSRDSNDSFSSSSDGFATHPPTPAAASTPRSDSTAASGKHVDLVKGMNGLTVGQPGARVGPGGLYRPGHEGESEASSPARSNVVSPSLGGDGESTGEGARIQRTDEVHHRIGSMMPGQGQGQGQ